MIQTLRKYKKILLLIVILFMAFLIYSYFKGGDKTNDILTATSPTGGSNNAIGQQFFNQLLTLQNLQLDDKVFADPRFQSLQDFSQPLPDEPQGRPNPFAPIGVDVSYGPTVGSTTVRTYNLNFTSSTSSAQRP